jgi:hypothetical protein
MGVWDLYARAMASGWGGERRVSWCVGAVWWCCWGSGCGGGDLKQPEQGGDGGRSRSVSGGENDGAGKEAKEGETGKGLRGLLGLTWEGGWVVVGLTGSWWVHLPFGNARSLFISPFPAFWLRFSETRVGVQRRTKNIVRDLGSLGSTLSYNTIFFKL